jgi:hypothetical protein
MKAKALMIAGLCGLVAALALPASSVAATPPTVFIPIHFTTSYDANECGIDVVETLTVNRVFKLGADYANLSAGEYDFKITNPATGKAVEEQIANASASGVGVDNGDGTFSVLTHEAGMVKLSVLNGPLLEVTAGEIDSLITFNDETFELVSLQVLHIGGSGPLPELAFGEGEFCPAIVSALT